MFSYQPQCISLCCISYEMKIILYQYYYRKMCCTKSAISTILYNNFNNYTALMASARARLTLTSFLKFQTYMVKNRNNIDAKLSRAASQHGSKTGFSSLFFSQPSAKTLEATMIISTQIRDSSILSLFLNSLYSIVTRVLSRATVSVTTIQTPFVHLA